MTLPTPGDVELGMNNTCSRSWALVALIFAGTATAQLPTIDPDHSIGRFVTHVSRSIDMTPVPCPTQVFEVQSPEVKAVTCATSSLDDVDFVLALDEAALAPSNPSPIYDELSEWEFSGGYMAGRLIWLKNDELVVVIFNMDTDIASFSQMQ